MAMSPASPPTVASRMTWWTLCTVTWICTSCHSSPWFPDFCHTYRKGRRLIQVAQWGCEEIYATLRCRAENAWLVANLLIIYVILQSAFHNCGSRNKLNVSQSNWKLWGANVSRLHRHWYTIGDCICVVPLFCSWGQSFAGASEGTPLWPRTCGAKTWNSTRHYQQVAAAGTSAGPCVLSHLVKNFWCTDIYLKNIHRRMMFCLLGAFFFRGEESERTLHNINILWLNIIAIITILLLITTIIMIILLIILTEVFKLCLVSMLTQSISKYFNTKQQLSIQLSVIGRCYVSFLWPSNGAWGNQTQMNAPLVKHFLVRKTCGCMLLTSSSSSCKTTVVFCPLYCEKNNLFRWCGLPRVRCWGFQWGRTRWSSPAGLQPLAPKHTDHPQRSSCT